MAKTHTDGGFYALVGFLYQFIGSFRYYITLQTAMSKLGDDEKLVFLLEAFDEDIAIIQEENPHRAKCTLVQFKYSEGEREIAPKMLKEICKSFDTAQKRANENRSLQMEYLLVTNQSFGRDAQRIWDDGHNALCKIKDKYGKSEVTEDEKALLEAILPMMQRKLRDIDQDVEFLQSHMAQFGVLEEEMDGRISQVVGHYFRGVADKKLSVDSSEFHEQLIGFAGARKLRSDEAARQMEKNMQRTKQDLGAPKSIRRRKVEQTIADLVANDYKAIITLNGEGGNGKSMTLCRVTEAALPFAAAQNEHSPLGQIPFGVICYAKDYRSHWLSQCIENWRGRTTIGSQELMPKAFARLEATKESEEAILIMGIDGLDEIHGESRAAIDDLIAWFQQEEEQSKETLRKPRAFLIVTSRVPEEIIKPNARPYIYAEEGKSKNSLSVGVFSSQEFALAMRDMAEQDASPRRQVYARLFKAAIDDFARENRVASNPLKPDLANAAFGQSSFPNVVEKARLSSQLADDDALELMGFLRTPQASDLLTLAQSHPSVSEPLYYSLLHPILWHWFDYDEPLLSHLGSKAIADGQMALLDGDELALSALTNRLIYWFKQKCELRRGVSAEYTDVVLRTAATATKGLNSKIASRLEHWEQPAAQPSIGVPMPTSLIVFNEALCSGLIESRAEAKWNWRHSFLQEVLAQ